MSIAIALAATSAPAQQATPYLPLDDPAYYYVNALVSRGALPGLGLLERPLTVGAIDRALAATDTVRLSLQARAWVRRLRVAVARIAPTAIVAGETRDLHAVIVPGLRGVAQTSGQRNLMLSDQVRGIYPGASLAASVSAGRVVAFSRMLADNRLRDDPEFAGKKDRWVRGRMEDAYVSAQLSLGELFFGRMTRNWGPAMLQGAHLGSAPYSYDHFGGRLGPERLHLTSLIARLDPLPPATVSGPAVQRYLAIHRLAGRVGTVEVAVSESYLYSGVGRGLSFSLSNPLNLYNLAQYNEAESGNAAYSLDAAWRGRSGLTLAGQFYLDDFQVDRCDPQCNEPSSWAATVSAEGLSLGSTSHRAFASYTRVTNLVYRTPDPGEVYTSFGVGLGRAFTDYDELRGGLDLDLAGIAPVRAYVAVRRQGEGDYRLPFPPPAAYASTDQFLAGTVRRVLRVGAEGGMTRGDLSATWDVGFNSDSSQPRALDGRIVVRWEPNWARLVAHRSPDS